jgi:hypothetical protein
MIEIKLTNNQAKSLEDYVEVHMEMCHNEAMGEDMPDDWEPYAPYCGCTTCESREYLMATFDWFKIQGILDVHVE